MAKFNEELFDILREGWNSLSAQLSDNFVCSMPARINACIAAIFLKFNVNVAGKSKLEVGVSTTCKFHFKWIAVPDKVLDLSCCACSFKHRNFVFRRRMRLLVR